MQVQVTRLQSDIDNNKSSMGILRDSIGDVVKGVDVIKNDHISNLNARSNELDNKIRMLQSDQQLSMSNIQSEIKDIRKDIVGFIKSYNEDQQIMRKKVDVVYAYKYYIHAAIAIILAGFTFVAFINSKLSCHNEKVSSIYSKLEEIVDKEALGGNIVNDN